MIGVKSKQTGGFSDFHLRGLIVKVRPGRESKHVPHRYNAVSHDRIRLHIQCDETLLTSKDNAGPN
jgi:hypothetical protein